MNDQAASVEVLTRRFGATTALHEVDLAVDAGTIVALIGPNGAGKTTLVRILSTLLKPSSGRASVAGFDVVSEAAEVRRRIGLTGQYVAIDQDLTGRENLVLFGRLLGLPRREARSRAVELMSEFELTDAAQRPVHSYSGGMRRRLDLAASLIARPEILFLDEPTEGLDPASRIVLWQQIARFARQGTMVFLTTHYLEEADELADRIVLIDRGRIAAEGTAEELKRRVGGRAVAVTLSGPEERARAQRALEAAGFKESPATDPNLLYVPVDDSAEIINLMERLGASGARVADLRIDAPSLDDVFLAMTGHVSSGEEPGGDGASAAGPPALAGRGRQR
jgi:daunorubicin resistance ABC transporter ATP-binding subunit